MGRSSFLRRSLCALGRRMIPVLPVFVCRGPGLFPEASGGGDALGQRCTGAAVHKAAPSAPSGPLHPGDVRAALAPPAPCAPVRCAVLRPPPGCSGTASVSAARRAGRAARLPRLIEPRLPFGALPVSQNSDLGIDAEGRSRGTAPPPGGQIADLPPICQACSKKNGMGFLLQETKTKNYETGQSPKSAKHNNYTLQWKSGRDDVIGERT